MKTKNRSHYFIALSVILCSTVLLGALTYALYGFHWRQGGRQLEIDFRASTGIKKHSSVRYAGARAGTVRDIRYLSETERRNSKSPLNVIRVTVQLDHDVPPIPSDVVAELTSETLLGEKFVLLSPGAPDTPPLPDGTVIQGQDIVGLDSVARSAQAAIEKVDGILGALKTDYPALITKLSDLLARGNALLEQGTTAVAHADGALTNATAIVVQFKSDYAVLMQRLNGILVNVRSVATNADQAVTQAGGLVTRADSLIKNNEGDLHQILEELRVVSQNLKVVSTYSKALTQSVGEKPSRLIWGRKKATLPSEQTILQSTNPVPIPSGVGPK